MKLRPYQERAKAELRAAYRAGKRAVALVSPTGSGKTLTSSSIMADGAARGTRSLFLTDRRELLAQTVRTLVAIGVTTVRVIAADGAAETIATALPMARILVDDEPGDALVTIASIPTLAGARWRDRLPPADLVIVDECHKILGPKHWLGLVRRYPNARILGLTATPYRGDNQGLGHVFDALVVGATVRELTDLGHLVPIRAWSPPEPLGGGRIAMSPLEAYQRFGDGRRAIVFAAGVEAAQAFAADLRAGGVAADHVDGKMPVRRRDEVLARWRAGELRVVANMGVLVEGFDDPEVAVAILARRFASPGPLIQASGRVLRPYPGKTHATIVDLCGSVLEHGLPDLPRTYSLEGRAISRPDRLAIRQCPACGGVFEAARVRGGVCLTCGGALAAERRKPARGGRGEVFEITAERMRTVLLANLQAAARERGLPMEVAERAAAALEARRSA